MRDITLLLVTIGFIVLFCMQSGEMNTLREEVVSLATVIKKNKKDLEDSIEITDKALLVFNKASLSGHLQQEDMLLWIQENWEKRDI